MKLSRKTNNRITGALAIVSLLCSMNDADPTGSRTLTFFDFIPNIIGVVLFAIVAMRCHIDYKKYGEN